MSEKLLKALMQLFAIIADVDNENSDNKSRIVVEQFLKQRLSQKQVVEYLQIYDEYLETHHKVSKKKEGKRKKTAVNSVKVLKICTQINAELEQKQKVFVLLRLVEYINIDNEPSDQELEFVDTVSDVFNIPVEELEDIKAFVICTESTLSDSDNILIINKDDSLKVRENNKHLHNDTLDGTLGILSVESVGMYALKYFGNQELMLNGQIIAPSKTYIFTQGSSIRSTKVNPIYYSDVISVFLSDKSESKIVFAVDQITYRFKNGKIGLHPLNFSEDSGKLIGIMGASGSGKSTLLNILNANYTPFSGSVKINGIDIHHQRADANGMVGYISQDDLLIDELTVYQNLFLNAKLCFDGLSDVEIKERVDETLKALGLYEIKHIQVGNPMNKKISGGQRKRLNCALELIREPSVLFVDEPTSGLSSRDSENIMDLLKELALKGKLIFVVIHQPSSEIFKMFDKLLILDTGGFPIYLGNPLDAIVYFKTEVNAINQSESECVRCGNVNPEQIFNIIEAKVVDEYGNLTDNRKMSPAEWNSIYLTKQNHQVSKEEPELPEVEFKTPNFFNQFKVFVTRDILSKITNTQYLAINLIEAPFLGFILSFFLRFVLVDDGSSSNEYVFYSNENVIVYMFMSVIVALFLGLTVSAEEIFKDQKIRKRESFLNLSNGSYLLSKIGIMFLISAIQMFLFILVGNIILGINGMLWDYWIILFSTACFANMLGLNISSSFNSAVTIYILIPFLIIPQILFSGVLVKFEKLNPLITSQRIVPLIGEIMSSRWAFEALAVNQFKNNRYEEYFFDYDQQMSEANFKKNFWIPALKAKIGKLLQYLKDESNYDKVEIARDLTTVRQELELQNKEDMPIEFENTERFQIGSMDEELLEELSTYLATLHKLYIKKYNANSDAKNQLIRELQESSDNDAFNDLRNTFENESLTDLVTNKNDFNQITEYDGKLIQRSDPIYNVPNSFRAHFYAPSKVIFGKSYGTKTVNIIVLWVMSLLLAIMLYFDGLKKLLDFFANIEFGRKS